MIPSRRLPWIAAGGAGLGAALFAATPAADRLVALPDGRRIHLVCRGGGVPTVVFEAGWAAGAASWGRVQDMVAERTTACAYDRAGTGGSDPGPLPRTAAAIADDLAASLKAGRVPGPYVLVAHSLGALPARVLASRPGGGIAGLVLADPSIEYQPQRMGGAASGFAPMIARARSDGRMQQASELEMLPALSSDEVAQAGPLPPGLPVIVLTGGRSQPNPAAQERWQALHGMIGGEHRIVADAGHMLPRDRPAAVADAALSLVARLRAR